MPSMAGKPQRAEEPETFYDSAKRPQQRERQPPKPDPNDRSSGYDVYDNYFDNSDNRQSGVGALGLGFLNGSMDDDDSDDDDPRAAANKAAQDPFKSKHELLAARSAAKSVSPPPTKQIAAPKPGYVAPIAALNLAKPESAAAPSGPGSQRRGNPNLTVATNQPMPPPTPESPHPLQASPITPAFARPRPPKAPEVTFEKGGIMRGDGEHTMLPKRGEAGDDFWRRFSMVAKENKSSGKQSTWLTKTQNGTSRLATWVWVVGLVLALCVAGGIGIGWYVSHKSPDHQQPTVFGGSAGEAAPSNSMKSVGHGNPSIKSSLAVRPTHTVQRRYIPRSQITAAPAIEEHRRAAGAAAWRH